MGFIKEFKEFAATGSLVDLAAGVVMGGAIAKVVGAFIDGMVMPAIGMVTGGTDFNALKYQLKAAVPAIAEVKDAAGKVMTEAVPAVEEVAIKWGAFISQIIQFLAVALVVFVALKAINKMKKAKAEEPAAPPADITLLTEIRDALRK
jgi:large conductance mechanosensitive channel